MTVNLCHGRADAESHTFFKFEGFFFFNSKSVVKAVEMAPDLLNGDI